jgi:hypothetical protein
MTTLITFRCANPGKEIWLSGLRRKLAKLVYLSKSRGYNPGKMAEWFKALAC